MRLLPIVVLGALALASCRRTPPAAPGSDCAAARPEPGVPKTCLVPGWPGKDVIVRLPSTGEGPRPLVLALHGGGGRKESMEAITCKDGDLASPHCLGRVAEARGVVVAYPDGYLEGRGRSWNDGGAGAAAHGWRSTPASEKEVDDVAYLRAVVDLIATLTDLDRDRVYATGLSNGASMSHRLACDAPDLVAAIAAVGGGNRAAVTTGCGPGRAVPVLQVHGDKDPVWPFAGGESKVAFIAGRYPSIAWAVMGASGGGGDVTAQVDHGWVARNECTGKPAGSRLPEVEDDGTSARVTVWSGCRGGGEVRFVVIEGGGHTWPGGEAYLGERVIGRVSGDVVGSELVLDFLLRWNRREGVKP